MFGYRGPPFKVILFTITEWLGITKTCNVFETVIHEKDGSAPKCLFSIFRKSCYYGCQEDLFSLKNKERAVKHNIFTFVKFVGKTYEVNEFYKMNSFEQAPEVVRELSYC